MPAEASSGIGQAAKDFFKKVKDKWKALPTEKKASLLTTAGSLAVAATSKSKKSAPAAEGVRGFSGPGFSAGREPDLPTFTRAPTSEVKKESKLARRMRSQFGG